MIVPGVLAQKIKNNLQTLGAYQNYLDPQIGFVCGQIFTYQSMFPVDDILLKLPGIGPGQLAGLKAMINANQTDIIALMMATEIKKEQDAYNAFIAQVYAKLNQFVVSRGAVWDGEISSFVDQIIATLKQGIDVRAFFTLADMKEEYAVTKNAMIQDAWKTRNVEAVYDQISGMIADRVTAAAGNVMTEKGDIVKGSIMVDAFTTTDGNQYQCEWVETGGVKSNIVYKKNGVAITEQQFYDDWKFYSDNTNADTWWKKMALSLTNRRLEKAIAETKEDVKDAAKDAVETVKDAAAGALAVLPNIADPFGFNSMMQNMLMMIVPIVVMGVVIAGLSIVGYLLYKHFKKKKLEEEFGGLPPQFASPSKFDYMKPQSVVIGEQLAEGRSPTDIGAGMVQKNTEDVNKFAKPVTQTIKSNPELSQAGAMAMGVPPQASGAVIQGLPAGGT